MGLISNGGEILLDFLELWQVLSPFDRDLRDPLWWPQERPVPMGVARGPPGIPLPLMPGPKTLCGVGSGTPGFLSIADMDLGVLWSLPRGVSSCLEWGMHERFPPELEQQCHASLLVDQAIYGFPSRLSHEAIP